MTEPGEIMWQDTVMKAGERYSFNTTEDMCQHQAEISFSLGEKEEYKKWIKACMKAGMLISKPEQLVNLHKAGIREVVGSVNLMLKLPNISVGNIKALWQAKLKEWGIK